VTKYVFVATKVSLTCDINLNVFCIISSAIRDIPETRIANSCYIKAGKSNIFDLTLLLLPKI
jgi:hypothetical protein